MVNLLPIPTNSVNPENAIVCYGLPTPVPVQKPVMQNHSNLFPKRKKGKKKNKTNSSEKQKPNPINANLVPVNKKPAVSWLSMASANPPPKASEVSDQPSTTKSSLVSVQQKSPVAGTSTLPDKPVTTSLALSTSSAQAAKSKKSQQRSQVLEAKKSTVSKTSHTSTRQPDLKNEKNTYVSDLVMVSQLHETANRKGLVAHFIFLEPSDLEFRFQLNNNNRLVILFFRLQYFIKH